MPKLFSKELFSILQSSYTSGGLIGDTLESYQNHPSKKDLTVIRSKMNEARSIAQSKGQWYGLDHFRIKEDLWSIQYESKRELPLLSKALTEVLWHSLEANDICSFDSMALGLIRKRLPDGFSYSLNQYNGQGCFWSQYILNNYFNMGTLGTRHQYTQIKLGKEDFYEEFGILQRIFLDRFFSLFACGFSGKIDSLLASIDQEVKDKAIKGEDIQVQALKDKLQSIAEKSKSSLLKLSNSCLGEFKNGVNALSISDDDKQRLIACFEKDDSHWSLELTKAQELIKELQKLSRENLDILINNLDASVLNLTEANELIEKLKRISPGAIGGLTSNLDESVLSNNEFDKECLIRLRDKMVLIRDNQLKPDQRELNQLVKQLNKFLRVAEPFTHNSYEGLDSEELKTISERLNLYKNNIEIQIADKKMTERQSTPNK